MTGTEHPAPVEPAAADRWSLSAPDVIGSLVALATLAVAQPLLDVIGKNAAFLVAHDATSVDVVLLALALTIGLPLVLAGVVLLLKRLHASSAAAVHALALAVFGTLLALVVLRLSGLGAGLVGTAVIALGVVLGIAVALTYRFSATFRRLALFAAFSAPVVAAMFVFATPAKALVVPTRVPDAVTDLGPEAPPIVMVIVDEFPLASLLDADHGVDPEATPAFARLARDATWFRNATTVHGQTSDAVPAALSGHYPDPAKLPIAADHPGNLFSLLSSTYDMNVVEPLTELCPPQACPRPSSADAARISTLVKDLAVVGSHLVVPTDMAQRLPPIDAGWKDFRNAAAETDKEAVFRDRFRAARANNPTAGFEEFIASVRRSAEPRLNFLHILLPHSPWRYTEEGKEYDPTVDVAGLEYGRWTTDEWRVAQGYQRHLVQVQLTDRLLGNLFDQLDVEGMYDESLIVVMADHGASLTPGATLRVIEERTIPEIAPVPLFIKRPHQTAGTVTDHPVELVDVLPTILDALGTAAPEGIDGRSAFDESAPRTEKRFYGPAGILTFSTSLEPVYGTADRKLDLFDESEAFPFPFGLAPEGTGHLLGQPAPAQAAPLPGATVLLENYDRYRAVDPNAPTIPSQIAGEFIGDLGGRPRLAVAMNGQIVAVTLVDDPGEQGRRFRALVPSNVLRPGENAIDVYLVGDNGELGRLDVQPAPPPQG